MSGISSSSKLSGWFDIVCRLPSRCSSTTPSNLTFAKTAVSDETTSQLSPFSVHKNGRRRVLKGWFLEHAHPHRPR